ncbi:MAG: hypothetical protein OJF48_000140 [Afipia sp.]|nr:MAG: hypothetical protein OJF48_000140 [Afipia sp.]
MKAGLERVLAGFIGPKNGGAGHEFRKGVRMNGA